MAVGSPTGQPCDVWREHYQYNSGSFGSTTGAPTDDFKWLACISGVPTRTARIADTTAYPTMPGQDSWIARIRLQKTANGAVT
jgi:hypothetical protein